MRCDDAATTREVEVAGNHKPSLEALAADFAKNYDPKPLCRAIETATRGACLGDLLGRLMLRTNLILVRPCKDRVQRRNAALTILSRHVGRLLGEEPRKALDGKLAKIAVLERGYRLLHRQLDLLLDGRDAARCFWATVSLGAHQVSWALQEVDRQARESSFVDGKTFTVPDGLGGRYPADQLIAIPQLR